MSNLTVSYVSQTPAVAPAGAPAAAPAADSPLGFLAALLDQILAAGKDAATEATAGANVDVPGLLNIALQNQTSVSSNASTPTDLLAALNLQLDKLQAGDGTDEGKLGDAVDALIAAIGTPAAGAIADPATDMTALRDRLAVLGQSLAATNPGLAEKLQTLAGKLEPVAGNSDALTIAGIIRSLLGHKQAADDVDANKAATAAPQVQDDLLQILATLGLNAPPAVDAAPAVSTETAAPVTATASVGPDLLRLSAQLTQVGTALTAANPDLAKKIEAVATRLVSTDADPDLLAKLSGAASQSDGTALDKLVQNLIDAKPVTAPAAAAPQIATATLPAPIAPKQSKSAVTEVKAAPPEPTPVTADSAPNPAPPIAVAAVSQEQAADPAPEPKGDAKVAAVVADAGKTDLAAQPAQPQQVAAQQARALPAAYQPVANPINMGQVAFEMVRQVHQGTSRFTIRLDPPEMGRVDVRMHVDASGAVNARLTVDRAETLDLFQRDRQSLERALAQAGLDASKTNLEFSLRQQSHNPFAGMMGGEQRQQQPGYGAPRLAAGSDDAAALPAVTLYRGTASAGGVNIFA